MFKNIKYYQRVILLVWLGVSAGELRAATDCNQVTEIPFSECQSLLELYNSTNGANWTNKTGWNQTNTPCSWFGVGCSGGHVGRLSLYANQLSGSIPNFTNLPKLIDLSLWRNQLSGSIPNFTNLPNLQFLQLHENQLSGSIPNFTNLPNLTDLSLKENQLSGSIPNFTNLPNLQYLSLYENQLSGSIPNFTNLPNLIYLNLWGSKLTGSIPNFTLPKLELLSLSSNQLSGSISDFTNLPNLQMINFAQNQLSGSIPNFTNLPNLMQLSLYENQLSGSIPNFTNLPKLAILDLFSNQLSGSIPNFTNLPKLINLSLNNNVLTGNIPNFSSFNLANLYFSFNNNCGLVAYDAAQETTLNQKDPSWKTKNPDCPIPHNLTLNKTGNGSISGGGSFTANSAVNLSAIPDADSKFMGWSPSPCATSFQMPANDLTCTATFVLKQKYSLNLTKSEHGTILAEGINCGADCNESYVENSVVTLNAMPETGYKLESWSGDCVGNSNSCQITMNGNKTVNASFSLIPSYPLTLQTSGTGLGSISGKGNYRVGETVNLTASPDANSIFVNWQPAPCNSSFQMPNQNLTCIATFNVSPPIDPVAQFTATPEMGNTPLKVTVNASASKGNIVNYQWVAVKNDKPSITFSTEGKESSFPLFTEKGIYSITLTITDNRNQTAKLTKSIRAGVSDLFFNVYRCATSSLNGFGGCEVTSEEQPFFSIGHKLKITLNSLLATNRFEPVSLWVAIQMPEGKFLFVISRPLNVDLRFHEPPNYNGEPFMANIELADRQDTILEFDVPLHFSGQYTLYALYAALGKNPLLDNSSWRSILATKSIILE